MTNLNSDELGEKGEVRFRELCVDAKLICNKSERDRVGWDFTVDFGFLNQSEVSLDRRLPPISCQVQVKTIMSSNRSIRVRLNMAERLAKGSKPAFIFILRVNTDNTFEDAYLLHIYEDRLAEILKKLRKETAEGTPQEKINKVHMTFTIKANEKIDITGESLRSAIEKQCGVNIVEYGAKKQEQIRDLGYEGAPFEMTVSFPHSQKEIEEIFLGMRERVDVPRVETFETRFNIKLPLQKPQAAKITIQPGVSSKCKLTFRATNLLPASLDADIYAVPRILAINGQERVRIKANLVEIDIYTLAGEKKLTLQTILPPDLLATIDEWGTYYRICQTFYLKGTLEIERVGYPLITLNLAKYISKAMKDNHGDTVLLCEKFYSVASHTGIQNTQKFHINDIIAADEKISLVHGMLTGEVTDLSFSIDPVNDVSTIPSPSTLFLANLFQVGPLHFAYYIKTEWHVEIKDEKTTIHLSDISLREIRLIDGQEFRDVYVERIKKIEDTTSVGYFET